MSIIGDDPANYVPLPWERHINMAARGDEVIAPFLQAIANSPSALDTVADIDELLAYLAASAIVMTTDGLVGNSGAADHFQYFDPQSGNFSCCPGIPTTPSDRRARYPRDRSTPSWAGMRW